jgi:hypothetical protein
VFDHVIAALVHGSGYERIATPGCSDRTIRRRLQDWATAGHGQALLRLVLAAFDKMIGCAVDQLAPRRPEAAFNQQIRRVERRGDHPLTTTSLPVERDVHVVRAVGSSSCRRSRCGADGW